jgi:peptide chain release factor subunit 1
MATTNSVKQHRLRKQIAWLSDKEGRGREFISLYLPLGTSVDELVANLKGESDVAVPKSDDARDRLQLAFKNVIQRLKLLKEIPVNGLAMFAGTFIANEGESEVLYVEELIPPEPITAYRCEVDNHFQLEPLRGMLREPRVVGLVAMDSKEASFGFLDGEHFELIGTLTSGVPGKSGKGGSSQRRYERGRDMGLTYFFHRVGEYATRAFVENHVVTALVVGGPGPTKEDFVRGHFLHYELENVLLSVVDTQSAGREGVREVLERSSDVVRNMCAPDERLIVRRLREHMGKQDGFAVYGLDQVLGALKSGEVEVALVTDRTGVIVVVVVCKNCGLSRVRKVDEVKKAETEREMTLSPCERCKAVGYEVEEKDIVDVLEDAASQTDARVEVISSESEEKASLAALGGFAAILRYRPG